MVPEPIRFILCNIFIRFLSLFMYNKKLIIDTRLFDEVFKARLIATIENLDEQFDGLLIHSENFQALNLLRKRYLEQISCVYIDLPYNTGNDGFPYKDFYQHSSWYTMIFDRIVNAKELLSNKLFSSIICYC